MIRCWKVKNYYTASRRLILRRSKGTSRSIRKSSIARLRVIAMVIIQFILYVRMGMHGHYVR